MAYTIEILGVDKTSLLKAGSLRVTRRTDKNNDCSLVLTTTAAGYLPKVGQDIKVKNSGTVIFGGCIKTISARKIQVGYGNTKKIELDVSSDGYRSIPARRTTTNSFDQRSAGYIVNHTLTNYLADEGITAGTIDTGADPVGDAGEYDAICKNCAEILDDMAQASGFKWYINDAKQLFFVQDDTVSDAAHDIVEGGAFTDYDIESYETTLDQYANKVFVRGGLGDDGNVIQTFEQDTTEQAAQQTIEGGAGYSTGVYGAVINDSNIDLLADATTAAQNALKKYGIIPSVLNITSLTLDWAPGTKVKVNLPTFGISTDTYYLIEELTLEDMDGKNLKCYMKASIRKTLDFSSQSGQSGMRYLETLVKKAKDGGSNTSTIQKTYQKLTQTGVANTAQVVADTSDTELCSVTVTIPTNSKVTVTANIYGVPSDALRHTLTIKLDTVTQKTAQKVFYSTESDEQTILHEGIIIPSGSHTIKLYGKCDAGTFTVDALKAVMLVGYSSNEFPTLADVTGFTAIAEVPPYQSWTTFPDSPVLTADYEYQVVFSAGANTRLIVSTAKWYYFFSGDIQLKSAATGKMYQLNAGVWEYMSDATSYSYTSLLQANADVYDDVSLATVYFAQTT
jgi:hypothetical protein